MFKILIKSSLIFIIGSSHCFSSVTDSEIQQLWNDDVKNSKVDWVNQNKLGNGEKAGPSIQELGKIISKKHQKIDSNYSITNLSAAEANYLLIEEVIKNRMENGNSECDALIETSIDNLNTRYASKIDQLKKTLKDAVSDVKAYISGLNVFEFIKQIQTREIQKSIDIIISTDNWDFSQINISRDETRSILIKILSNTDQNAKFPLRITLPPPPNINWKDQDSKEVKTYYNFINSIQENNNSIFNKIKHLAISRVDFSNMPLELQNFESIELNNCIVRGHPTLGKSAIIELNNCSFDENLEVERLFAYWDYDHKKWISEIKKLVIKDPYDSNKALRELRDGLRLLMTKEGVFCNLEELNVGDIDSQKPLFGEHTEKFAGEDSQVLQMPKLKKFIYPIKSFVNNPLKTLIKSLAEESIPKGLEFEVLRRNHSLYNNQLVTNAIDNLRMINEAFDIIQALKDKFIVLKDIVFDFDNLGCDPAYPANLVNEIYKTVQSIHISNTTSDNKSAFINMYSALLTHPL